MTRSAPEPAGSEMVLIRGGAFEMGSDAFYADERPVRSARVGDFFMDRTPVTYRQFAAFVAATGYVTAAERAPDPADYPGLSPEDAKAGSAVFTPTPGPVPLQRAGASGLWWRWVVGAEWRHPLGPERSVEGLEDHPVTHVVAADAEAYAAWADKTLPTEAEWEYAARGGLAGRAYAWGDELHPQGQLLAKTWQGEFPWRNAAPPGLERTSPVGTYPPNGYGLFDMIGNVWEWTADWYAPSPVAEPNACCGPGGRLAERASADPQARVSIPRRVTKGGSHLCAPEYCQRYRPAARWPQPIDTSTSHVGFRCIRRL